MRYNRKQTEKKEANIHGVHPCLISDVWYPRQHSTIRIKVSLLSPVAHRIAFLYDVHANSEALHNIGTFSSRTQTCCLNSEIIELLKQTSWLTFSTKNHNSLDCPTTNIIVSKCCVFHYSFHPNFELQAYPNCDFSMTSFKQFGWLKK